MNKNEKSAATVEDGSVRRYERHLYKANADS